MINWFSQWEWTPESVIALIALLLSVGSWMHVLHVSARRVRAYVRQYTLWPQYEESVSTLLMYASVANASQQPIGVTGIAVRFANEWCADERHPTRPVLVHTPGGNVPWGTEQIRVTPIPLNLNPYHAQDVFVAVSGNTATMPPAVSKASMRFRTSRRIARCVLSFDTALYTAPNEFLAEHNIVSEPQQELQY